ncbi:6264_t:CDS:1, partial [Scutellospora calospora]
MKSKKLSNKTKPTQKKTNRVIKVVDVKFPPDLQVDYFIQGKKERCLKFPNAFMFFRSVYNQELRNLRIKLSQSDVSASASYVWNGSSTEVKDFYNKFASEVRKQYLVKYPVAYFRCEYQSESKSMVNSKEKYEENMKKYSFISENQKIAKKNFIQETSHAKEIPKQLDNSIYSFIDSTSSNDKIFTEEPSFFNNDIILNNFSYENQD